MSDFDFLNDYSAVELKKMQPEIERLIKAKEKQEKEDIRKQLANLAAENGYSIDDLFSGNAKSARVSNIKPKYYNPEDPQQTWTGRGRQPLWVKDYLGAGKSLDDIEL
ncbi:MAG: H-NS histone family protein [bacterium]